MQLTKIWNTCIRKLGSSIFILLVISISGYSQTTEEARALWVTRWDYTTATHIQNIIDRAKNANFNIILFQVRGNFDAFYQSNYEPWAVELGGLGQDPGWDPLAEAVTRAHTAGLELHAYINTFPMWKGTTAPPSSTPEHVYNAHRDWLCCDTNGTAMALNSSYVNASPGIPAVQDHIYNVVMDIVTRYNVDGVHFDYIRYPDKKYSHDTVSVQRFNDRTPTGGNPNSLSWEDWQRDQITRMVERIYNAVAGPNGIRPSMKISAAVWGIYKDLWGWGSSQGYYDYYQDSRIWLAKGIMDFICPMIYWPINNQSGPWNFATLVKDFGDNSYGRHVYAGMWDDYASFTEINDEIVLTRNTSGNQGNTHFAYSSLNTRSYWDDFVNTTGPYKDKANVPSLPWKIYASTGMVSGIVTKPDNITPISNISIQFWQNGKFKGNKLTGTDGKYSVILATGTYTIIASAQGYTTASAANVVVNTGQSVVQNFIVQSIMGTISGRVLETGTTTGIQLTTIDMLQNNVIKGNTQTGSDGRYLLTVTSGTYNVRASALGYVSQTLPNTNLISDTTTNIDFTLVLSTSFSSTGFWHQVYPGNTYFNSHSSSSSWWYGQDATGNYDNSLQNSGDLVSPFYGLVTKQSKLTFWSWEQTDNQTGLDRRLIYVSADNGINWTQVSESLGPQQTWHKIETDLSAFSGKRILVKFRFDSVNDSSNTCRGWYVDEVGVSNLGGYVSGKVTQPDGTTPLNGAKVKVLQSNTEISTGTTNSQGNYTLLTPSGTWSVRASYTGYEPMTLNGINVALYTTTQNVNFLMAIAVDSATPTQVTDLAAVTSSVYIGAINLTWTAPGDDGTIGDIVDGLTEVRYSSSVADTANTASRSVQWGGDVRLASIQTKVVSGLIPGATYYLWVRAADDVRNWGGFSNTATTYANMDCIAPSKITGFTVSTGEQIKLSWTSPGNNGLSGTIDPGVFEIQYTSVQGNAPDSAGNYSISITTTCIPSVTYTRTVTGLLPWTTYYFWIRTQDESLHWSEFSSTKSITAGTFLLGDWQPATENAVTKLGDYNNDGYLDIGVISPYGPTRVYRNNGNGTATLVWSSTEQNNTSQCSLAWGDYNNDGLPDLLVGNYGEVKRVYRNNGNNTFSLVWSSTESDNTDSVAWGDFNNDGKLDFIVGNYRQPARLYRNNGNNTFSLVWSSTETYSVEKIVCGDFDNNGYTDFAVANSRRPGVAVFRNNSNNTFTVVWTVNLNNTYAITWADIENDGDLDLVAVPYGQTVRVYRNTNGTFAQSWASTGVQNNGNVVSCADFDNDGYVDIIVGNSNQYTRLFINNKDGTFQYKWASSQTYNVRDLAVGDWDNDGDIDVIMPYLDQNYDSRELMYVSIRSLTKSNSTPQPPTTGFINQYANGILTLSWSDGSDMETSTNGLYYNVRVGTNPGAYSIVSTADDGTLLGKYSRPKISSSTLGVRLMVPDGATYYWSVQTIDTGFKSSSWSIENNIYLPLSRGTVTGKVVANDGITPLSSATVQILLDTILVQSVTTDNNGNYSLSLTTGVYSLKVYKTGYMVQTTTGVVILQDQTTSGINFIVAPATGEIILDDADSNVCTIVGSWTEINWWYGYYGTSARITSNTPSGQYVRWTPTITIPGCYEVYAWWAPYYSEATNAAYNINYASSSVSKIYVDQTSNDGQWNKLGTFYFNTGTEGYVTLANDFTNGSYVIADAIRLVPIGISGKILEDDNSTPVVGATVTITNQSFMQQTLSDNNGIYFFPIASGLYSVEAAKYGYYSKSIADVSISTGQITGNVNFVLERDTNSIVEITGVSPMYAVNTGTLTITIQGTSFKNPVVVKLTRGTFTINPIATNRVSVSTITCVLNLSGLMPNKWDVIVENGDGRTVQLLNSFVVLGDRTKSMAIVGGLNNKIKVEIPANGLATDAYVSINPTPIDTPERVASLDILDANYANDKESSAVRLRNSIVEFNVYDSTGRALIDSEFLLPVTITLPYDDTDNDGVIDYLTTALNQKTLNVYVLVNKQWVKVDNIQRDFVKKNISVYVPHLSVFAIMGRPAALDLEQARIYPNPYTETSPEITFSRITKDAEIKIYTLTGELVRTLYNESGDDIESWDTTNEFDEKVASGIYFFIITDSSDHKKTGKLAIIR